MTEAPMTDTGTVTCRGCRRVLRGSPYHLGGHAYHPDTGETAKANFYGGWVCSRSCDVRASLELERSMPGHGHTQMSVGGYAAERIERNWGRS